jgi:hypothetical protein
MLKNLTLFSWMTLAACGGANDAVEHGNEAIRAAPAVTHTFFVCKRSDPKSTPFVFAFDEEGRTTLGDIRSGYCEVTTDADGRPIGSFLCFVDNVRVATTSNARLVLEFQKSDTDGLDVFTLLNLPNEFVKKRGGTGLMRVAKAPASNLAAPLVAGAESVDSIDCQSAPPDFEPTGPARGPAAGSAETASASVVSGR